MEQALATEMVELRLYDAQGRLQLRVLAQLIVRCIELCVLFGPVALTGLLLQTPLHARCRAPWLRFLVRTLARCGPVGIKWGQWASTRYDLFEDDVCQTLGELTNQAPVHSLAHTEKLIALAFGAPPSELFSSFDTAPLASGSIAQVHTATLKATNQRVAIKVQHPRLAETLPIDMWLLRGIASLSRLNSTLKELRIDETVDQFATNFMLQLDFHREAHNLRRFAANFASPFWSALVSFPQPIEGLVAPDVLVETFEPGTSVATYLTSAEGEEERRAQAAQREKEPASAERMRRRASAGLEAAASQVAAAQVAPVAVLSPQQAEAQAKALAMKAEEEVNAALGEALAFVGLQAFLKMLISDNFIHADLHPGNVLIRFEAIGPYQRLQRWLIFGESGALAPHMVFLDAGLAASFDTRINGEVGSFFSSIINFRGRDFGEAILGMSPTQPLVKDPETFIAEVTEKMFEMKADLEVGQGRAGVNIRNFMSSVRGHHVQLDPSVMVSLMSMMVLEGWQFRLAKELPIFDSVKVALGGFGAQVFFKALKDRVMGGQGNIAGQLEAEREETLHQSRRLTAAKAA